jgi:hypothetical protein
MNRHTWDLLIARGVTEETLLTLDFFYNANGEREASALNAFIASETDYDVNIRSTKKGSFSRRSWSVSGSTTPTTVSLDILDQWVRWMLLAGFDHGPCEFDGWGAQIPRSPGVVPN